MRLVLVAFAALIWCSTCSIARAGQVCPWLNSATAAGVLGGPVDMTVTHPGGDEEQGVCEFAGKGRMHYVLRIEVHTMSHLPVDFTTWLAQCDANATPVRAIGNQAVACDATKQSEVTSQILSRVRWRAFLVRVSADKVPVSSLRQQARDVAEQVAGNLF